jgi:protein-S-isoprenylcysteine O-methyltransferase Ste14
VIVVGGILHLLVVTLPLLCLGLGIFSTSLRDPATLVFLVGASVLYAGDAITMQWKSSETRSPLNVRAKRWAAVTGGLLLLLFWACLVERAVTVAAGSWLQAFGGALLLSGVTLRALAVRTLGRTFRTEIEGFNDALVRDGVYRFLRHPSETGLLTASLGAAVLLQSVLGLGVWCGALLPVTLARLALEERALELRFGTLYERYAEEVGGLVPLSRGR